jgi:16S rRNA (guanine966-N2)-methyltransferase
MSLMAGRYPRPCTVAPVRVISGTARGRRLLAPEGSDTRPTPERVREATFNALGSLGAVVDATVLDLFAGSGAMGIEALSRGAAQVTFVDRDIRARRAIEANLAACGLEDAAEIVATPVERFVAEVSGRRWDVALLDPPYDYDGWPELLLDLPADLAVLESSREVDPPFGWEVRRSKRYGRTHVVIAERVPI